MEIPWLLLLWTALFGAVLSYDVEEPVTSEAPEDPSMESTTAAMTSPALDDDLEEDWAGVRPGFEFKVTQNGLNYAANIAIDTLMLKLMNLSIPAMEEQIGPAKVSIHSVRVTDFPRPRSVIRLIPQQGLRWRVKGLSPVIKAAYETEAVLAFWKILKKGNMNMETKNLQFSLDFFLGRDAEGRPTITVFDCNAKGEVDVSFDGDFGRVLNMGSRLFRRKIKSLILEQVCASAKSEINEKAGWALSKFRVVEDIPPDFEIDFSLVKFPAFKNHSVHTYHKGAFFYKPNRVEPPFQPAEIPFFPRHRRRMVYVYVTSYMLNSAFYALYANNKLAINVTSRQVPPHVKKYFASTCPNDICLGSLIPELRQHYPDSDVAVSVSATQAPHVSINSGNIRLTGALSAHIYVRENNRPVKILSVAMNVTGAVRVIVSDDRVTFNVSGLKSRADVEYSKMGQTNSEVFENMVNAASKEFLLPVLRDIGGTGFTLPELEDVMLIRPTVINVDGLKDVMIIASDFEIYQEWDDY